MGCEHTSVACLNEYELIRKYRCLACAEVMMCLCDRDVGETFLTHQLREGTELRTQRRCRVTLGFVDNICRECRGLGLEAHPVGEIHGRTSKIARYYWREIAFLTYRLYAQRMARARLDGSQDDSAPARSLYREAGQEALARVKSLHEASPKYEYEDESQEVLLRRYDIEVVRLDARFGPREEGMRSRILTDDGECSAEEFVESHYRREGWNHMRLESRPFHVLFGVFLWLVIQDPMDDRGRTVGFGCKRDYAVKSIQAGEQIWTQLPEDFGSPGFAERRADAIEAHFSRTMDPTVWSLAELFDYWLEPSEFLRDYLWAHDDEDIIRARRLLQILPEAKTRAILRHLIGDYWGRYVGWPDLMLWKGGDFILAEVKASKDKLSQGQRRWIENNAEALGLPFKLVKIHRVP